MLYHILSYEKSGLLKIDNIGFSSDPKICHFGPGQRELYLIHYVIEGEGYFNGNKLKKGQGFLVTPQAQEHYFPVKNNPWKILWVTSHDATILEIFDTYAANAETNIFEYSYVSVVNELTGFIQKNHNRVYSATEILEIFLSVFNHQKKLSSSNAVDTYYDYALDFVNSNMFRTIRVSDLTEALGISQPYLYRIFKEKCGLSPQEKIIDLKIRNAKRLLTQTSMSISNIAYSLGFGTPQDFSKFFKKNTGISPANYRKSI